MAEQSEYLPPASAVLRIVPAPDAALAPSCLQAEDCISRYPLELQSDAWELYELLSEITGCEAVMWGPAVIGFGQKKPAARPESPDDGFELGFARRGNRLVLVLRRFAEYYAEILGRLGEAVHGKNAITLPAFENVDKAVLRELIERAWNDRARAD